MATTAQQAFDAASCYDCYAANQYMLTMIELGMLKKNLLALDPNADVTPQGLLAAAKCYQCYAANEYMLLMMKVALLKAIADTTA